MTLEIQLTDLFLQKVVLSLLVGALIGLEREYTKDHGKVGVRTFSLISLLGGVTAIFSQQITQSIYVVLIGLIIVCVFSTLLYFETIKDLSSPGFTTNITIVLAYLLGASAGYGLFMESIFLSVLIAVVLFSRERMHNLVENLTEKEVTDLLEFAVVLGIIYPLIPTEPIQIIGIPIPLKTVWALIVIISLINFASFIGSRHFKASYEVPLVSFLGGLVSASGIAASISTQLKENKGLEKTLTGGFLFAASALIIKNLGFASALNTASAKFLILPMVISIIPLLVLAFYKTREASEKSEMKITSPFHIKKAAKFGVAILLLIIIVEITQEISSGAVILTAFIAGTVSSTSMTLSLISLSLGGSITLTTFVLAEITTTVGSFLGKFFILDMGKTRTLIKNTLIPISISIALLLISFTAIYILIGV